MHTYEVEPMIPDTANRHPLDDPSFCFKRENILAEDWRGANKLGDKR